MWADGLLSSSLAQVATSVGLRVMRSGTLGPCPACRAENRGDSRGPIGSADDRHWRCHRCGAGGSALALVAYATIGRLPARGDRDGWASVRAAASSMALADAREARTGQDSTPTPRAPQRAYPEGVAGWVASLPRAASVPEVAAWIRSRGSDPERLDVYAGERWPAWALRWWHRRRAVFALHDSAGRVVSVRCRAIGPVRGPKASGPACGGAVLASPLAVSALRGEAAPMTWLVVEGEPDWMAWTSRRPDVAVVGVGSGWFDASIAARVPAGAVIAVATHADRAGAEYARRIEAMLPGRVVGYAPPPRGDWADLAVAGWDGWQR